MVIRNALLALASVLALAQGTAGQQRPEVTVGVRPQRVRVGEVVVVTVRTVAPVLPDQVDIDPGESGEVLDYRDRSSAGVGTPGGSSLVFEREFDVLAAGQGTLSIPAVVVFGGDTITQTASPVSVHPPGLAWPRPPTLRIRRSLH